VEPGLPVGCTPSSGSGIRQVLRGGRCKSDVSPVADWPAEALSSPATRLVAALPRAVRRLPAAGAETSSSSSRRERPGGRVVAAGLRPALPPSGRQEHGWRRGLPPPRRSPATLRAPSRPTMRLRRIARRRGGRLPVQSGSGPSPGRVGSGASHARSVGSPRRVDRGRPAGSR